MAPKNTPMKTIPNVDLRSTWMLANGFAPLGILLVGTPVAEAFAAADSIGVAGGLSGVKGKEKKRAAGGLRTAAGTLMYWAAEGPPSHNWN